ncbi:MAG: YHS domain-containing protein, partial [Alphaproteobacteria bacterium]
MKTPICPNCGCSLVRLGISKEAAVAYGYEGEDYYFCCDGCLEQFIAEPEKRLRETAGLIVCPVCLGEKTPDVAAKIEFGGNDVYLCRCPHCLDAFNKNPEYYIKRLEGVGDHPGTF